MKLLTKIINLFKSHPIQIGAVWYWTYDIGNPFKEPQEATVLEFKNGWVKYKTKYETTTAKESSFRDMYKPSK